MRIFIGADHRGFRLKEAVKFWLTKLGYEVTDVGNSTYDQNDDFPDFSFAVADAVKSTPGSLGIVICGSGGGVTMTANKVAGIRCGQAVTADDVKHNRSHNDMNVLALGSDYVSEPDAITMIRAFLETPFDNSERFVRRLNKIKDRE